MTAKVKPRKKHTVCTAHYCYWPDCKTCGCTKPLQVINMERRERRASRCNARGLGDRR